VIAVKKIQCADPHCDGVIAHQISDKTFELKRLDQAVTMTGNNWSTLARLPESSTGTCGTSPAASGL
jgi:hypothetical protein